MLRYCSLHGCTLFFFRGGKGGQRAEITDSFLHLGLRCFWLYNFFMRKVQEYKQNSSVTYSCKYHVVWCPKYRRKVLMDGIEERLQQILRESVADLHVEILELEIMPDHVHLICEVDPQFGIHRLVKLLKGRSSRILRKEYPKLKSRLPTLWTNSYFVSTVGGSPLSAIKQYIEQQKNV